MIHVCSDMADGFLLLSVKGHAGYADYGHDIVCAAVSAITYTYAAYAEKIGGTVSLSPGFAEIKTEDDRVLHEIAEGYRLIAEKYPQYVMLDSGLLP